MIALPPPEGYLESCIDVALNTADFFHRWKHRDIPSKIDLRSELAALRAAAAANAERDRKANAWDDALAKYNAHPRSAEFFAEFEDIAEGLLLFPGEGEEAK